MSSFKINSIADCIAATVCQFGFIPRHSITVSFTLGGGSTRLGKQFRIDLEDAKLLRPVAAQFSSDLDHPDALVIVFDGNRADAERAAAAIAPAANVLDVLYTDLSRVWSVDDLEQAVGEPVNLDNHPLVAESVSTGRVVLRSREDLETTFSPGSNPQIIDAASIYASRLDADTDPHQWLTDARALVERGITGETLSDAQVAHVVAASRLLPARDYLWSLLKRDNATATAEFWAVIARRTPADHSAPALALAGFSAWVSGNGAAALCAADAALKVAPDYEMAHLLNTTIESMTDPKFWDGVTLSNDAMLTRAVESMQEA